MAVQRKKKSAPIKVNKAPKQKPSVKSDKFTAAVGRRKTASARVRLSHGGNVIVVNGKPSEEYFKSVDPQGTLIREPLKIVNALKLFSISVKVVGSGAHSQFDAAIHGIARTLAETNDDYKLALRKAGLLTRDPRMKESRKIGTGGKARRAKQSPKR